MAWSEKARCVLVANGGDDGQGKVRMVKATLLKSQSAAIYIAILAKATVTPGPDDDSGLMSWPPVSQPIRAASGRGVDWRNGTLNGAPSPLSVPQGALNQGVFPGRHG